MNEIESDLLISSQLVNQKTCRLNVRHNNTK